MDNRAEVRAFLSSRRARISPQDAGLPLYGTRRRVPGLRREEVAQLAGVSTDYYARLEKGNLTGASEAVLEAIAGALRLDDVERAHLFDLAAGAGPGRRHPPRRGTQQVVRPSIQRVLASMQTTAAFVRTGRLDVLAFNDLASALYSPAISAAAQEGPASVNLARFVFLAPAAQTFYSDWTRIAADAVGSLRAEAGRDPNDRLLTDLVGHLSLHSEAFRTRWASADVRSYRSGTQTFVHPQIGELTLNFDALDLPADPGQTIVAYTAALGSQAASKLEQLAKLNGMNPHSSTGSLA